MLIKLICLEISSLESNFKFNFILTRRAGRPHGEYEPLIEGLLEEAQSLSSFLVVGEICLPRKSDAVVGPVADALYLNMARINYFTNGPRMSRRAPFT